MAMDTNVNDYIVYAIAIVALMNIIYYLANGNIRWIMTYILLGIVVYMLSNKNLIFTFGIPLIIANLFAVKTSVEGFSKNANATNAKATNAKEN